MLRPLYPNGAPGSGGTPGSVEQPYAISGASVAEVLASLASVSAVDGAYATATVDGQTPVLMVYNQTDDAWYETGGGHGTELAPYWTTSTGDDGVEALPAPASGLYGVVGKGTGSPFTLRGLVIVATDWATAASANVGSLQSTFNEWVSPTLYAKGTPSTAYVLDRTVSPWTASVGSGGAVNYNSAVANRLAVKSGTGASSSVSVGTKSSSSALGILMTRAKVAGMSTATGSASYVRALSTSESAQFVGLAVGGTTAANATEWHTWGTSGIVATGVACGTEKRLEALLTLATDAFELRVDGASSATFSTTCTATTATGAGAEIVANPQNSASVTVSARRVLCMEWN